MDTWPAIKSATRGRFCFLQTAFSGRGPNNCLIDELNLCMYCSMSLCLNVTLEDGGEVSLFRLLTGVAAELALVLIC